jgi:hypothetical protein
MTWYPVNLRVNNPKHDDRLVGPAFFVPHGRRVSGIIVPERERRRP